MNDRKPPQPLLLAFGWSTLLAPVSFDSPFFVASTEPSETAADSQRPPTAEPQALCDHELDARRPRCWRGGSRRLAP